MIVTRSSYAQVDAIQRAMHPDSAPEPVVAAMSASFAVPMAASTATVVETTGRLFPEPAEVAELTHFAHHEDTLVETPIESFAEEEVETSETSEAQEATISEATNRAAWIEHVAHMEELPSVSRSDSGLTGIQQLPPDADTVGWASDAVGWVTEVAERRSNLPEETPFEEILIPELEEQTQARTGRAKKSRHTIELVLAVVLLTWALVFLGYQMGSTGASRNTNDLTVAAKPSVTPPAAAVKGSPGKTEIAPSESNPSLSAEAFPESGVGNGASSVSGAAADGSRLGGLVKSSTAGSSRAVAKPMPSTRGAVPAATTGSSAVAATAPSTLSSGVVLQVGAMKVQNNATAMVQDLKKKKFPAFVYQHGKDNLYRVGVGPYGDTDSSAKVKSELEKDGYKTITSKWIRE